MSILERWPSSELSGLVDGTPQRQNRTFPKSARLLDGADFRGVTASGRRLAGRYFLLFTLKSTFPNARLGLTVSRKVGNAVVRNSIKRQMREFFRMTRALLDGVRVAAQADFLDVVLIARPQAGKASAEALHQDLQKLFSSIVRPP